MRQGPRSARQTTAPRSPGEGAEARPSYRWCSARRSSPGCTRTCRPGRSHARRSAGGRRAGRRPPPSSRPRSGRCPPRRRRGHHTRPHRSLGGGREKGEREKTSIEPVVLGNKGHTLCEQSGFQRLRRLGTRTRTLGQEQFSSQRPVPSPFPRQNRMDCRALLCSLFSVASLSPLLCLPLPKGTTLLNRCEETSNLIKNQLCVKTK